MGEGVGMLTSQSLSALLLLLLLMVLVVDSCWSLRVDHYFIN